MRAFTILSVVGLLLGGDSFAGEIRNGGFEEGLAGWREMFQREPGSGGANIDSNVVHAGKASARIEYRGKQDWSFEPDARLTVQAGDIIEAECWVKAEGATRASLAFSLWSPKGENMGWSEGGRENASGDAWQLLRSRVVVAHGVAQVQPRLLGSGNTRMWVDEFSAAKKGNVLKPGQREVVSLGNQQLQLSIEPTNGLLTVKDSRSGRTWSQVPFARDLVITGTRKDSNSVACTLYHGGSGLEITARFRLEPQKPELVCELDGAGDLNGALQFPQPFAGIPGDYLVVPMNEGISYPVEEASIEPMRLIAYGGHGICMAFFGLTDGERGVMGILETPDDAAIRIARSDGRLAIAPEWEGQRGAFGYMRRVRYVFFASGGHVAMAKRYRQYASEIGLLKTLADKRKENPEVDRLIGAVNVWCWDKDAVSIVRDLKAAGIERILWSNRQTPENLKALNELGVLTSRYDIYQDVMAPTNFLRLQWVHPDWTTGAWPQDIIRRRDGSWIHGWGVEAKDGTMIPCGVICDRQALKYARQRIPEELATHPYRCRFIDTTTAAPWHECYDPAHPMTRTESKRAKMELLRYVSEPNKLVTGCETGHDASVPYLHYFEGMLSLGPYRVPDSGRRMQVIWTNVPNRVAKFQLGHKYRLPLWELVYHDCVVSQWYWGDYNNKLPPLWEKRDLFNLLYGTPPMFMFNRKLWEDNRERFAQSYRNTSPHVREVGYEEMTDHRFLTADRSVQQTVFANGTRITVNFGEQPFRMPDGKELGPDRFDVAPRKP